MNVNVHVGAKDGNPAETTVQKSHYTTPHLVVFGSVASVTGSGMAGSFLDCKSNKINDSTKSKIC